jgi:hypothetical protein
MKAAALAKAGKGITIRGDDDCALDMASLPPRSDAGQDVR